MADSRIDWAARADEHWQRAEAMLGRAEAWIAGQGTPDTARARVAAEIALAHAQLSDQAGARAYLSYSIRNIGARRMTEELEAGRGAVERADGTEEWARR